MTNVTNPTDVNNMMLAASEHPEDHARHLVYADALEESGDQERAEFVRLQAERQLWPSLTIFGARYQRERELLGQHGPAWLAALPTLDGVGYQFERGLPVAVAADFAAATRHAAALVRAGVRALRVERLRGVEAVNRCEALARIRSLTLANCRLSARAVGLLAGCAHLAGLRSLNLERSRLPTGGAAALAGSPHLGGLRALGLSHTGIGIDDINVLGRSDPLSGVQDLDLSENGLKDTARYVPGSLRGLTSLRNLALGRNDIWSQSMLGLLASVKQSCPSLRRLSLDRNPIGDWGVLTLSTANLLPKRLEGIDLSVCSITSDGVMRLLGTRWLGRLTALLLLCNNIGPVAAARLRGRLGNRIRLLAL
jgi:uncharacterized protein (TIGR02996 family)